MVKILEADFESGFVKIIVNDKLDLWHLENIIEKGDSVSAKSPRHIFVQREEGREKSRKKFVKLKISVEKIEFSKNRDRLRIKGMIIECPKDVPKGYHTIEVGLGSKIEIEKKWGEEQIRRLESATGRIVVSEPKTIEEFFIHVDKDDGLAAYGIEQVGIAAEMGAVKIVLVPEERIKDKSIEEILKNVESKKGEIRTVSLKNLTGKKFCRMYDIAAILRFPIS